MEILETCEHRKTTKLFDVELGQWMADQVGVMYVMLDIMHQVTSKHYRIELMYRGKIYETERSLKC